jgi:DDE superfamily endonuclease
VRPGRAAGPVAIFDCGYSARALTWALAGTGVQVLVRIGDEGRRVFFAAPPAREPGATGRPPRHGQRFKLAEAVGWPTGGQELIVADSGRYGRVEVRA